MPTDNTDNALFGSTIEDTSQSASPPTETPQPRNVQSKRGGRGTRGRAGAAFEDENADVSADSAFETKSENDEQDEPGKGLRGLIARAGEMAKQRPVMAIAAGVAFGFILRGLVARRSRED